MTIAAKLEAHFPGQAWAISGDDYASLDWAAGNTLPKPSRADLDALPDPGARVALLSVSTAAFKARRDGGFTLNGLQIATDEESRGLIDGALSLANERPDHVFDFRASGAWVHLDAATIKQVALTAGLWVQACYTARRQAEAGIADGSLATEAAVLAVYAAVALPA